MKGNPSDVRGFAEDLERAINDHPDVMQHNRDLKNRAEQLRDDAFNRYYKVSENAPVYDKNGDLIP